MIAACPNCKTKFRIARERLDPEGVRLRCTQCSSVFRVKAPVSVPEPVVPAAFPQVAVAPQPVPQPPAPAPGPPSESPDSTRLVVVAHSDAELCKGVREALERWGLQVVTAHDGVEAILAIQRHLPRAVLLDAALPKMYGFQVCELVKRNDSLRSIQVVLAGAIHDDARYRRTPDQLYGADVYLETPDLPDGLYAALRGFGLSLTGRPDHTPVPAPLTHRGVGGIDVETALEAAEPPPEPAAAAPAPERVVPPPPAPEQASLPVAPGPFVETPPQSVESPAPADDDAIAKAERLARIIVSDVILYNEEKFAAAIAAGNVLEALEADLQEGRSLFQSRTDPAVAGQRDFLRDELLRVARQRGMQ